MDYTKRLVILLIFSIFFTMFIFCDDVPNYRVKVKQIFVPVSVTSLSGDPVTGLTKKDFRIYENGIEQKIINFASEEVPLNVVFLMDVSGSTYLESGDIKQAIIDFSKELKPQDREAIISFNNQSKLILDWCNDLYRVERALDRVMPKGSTVWYDTLYVTFTDLLKGVKGKKVVIGITDGVDTGSIVSFDDALNKAIDSNAQVYIISQTSKLKDLADYYRRNYGARINETDLMKTMYAADSQLKEITYKTGGRLIYPDKLTKPLNEIFVKLIKELRQEYYISYKPHNIFMDGSYRKIKVVVKRPNVLVRYKPGYYAR